MNKITVTKIIHKPKIDTYKVDIYGHKFTGFIMEPKIYVIETSNDILKFENQDIEFEFGILKYTLRNITEHPIDEPEFKMLECTFWSETVIDEFNPCNSCNLNDKK